MAPPDQIHIVPAPPTDWAPRFGLCHPYVEHVWGAALGPTSVVLLRRVGVLLEAFPDGVTIDAVEFGRSLGVGSRSNASTGGLGRTLERLAKFGLAGWDPEAGRLTVPAALPTVPAKILAALPESTRRVHQSLTAGRTPELDSAAVLSAPTARSAATGPVTDRGRLVVSTTLSKGLGIR